MFAKSVIDMTLGQGTFGEMCLRSRIGYFCIAMSDKHAEYLTCKLRLAALKFMAEEGCALYNPRYATALGASAKAKAKAKADPNKDLAAAKAKATAKKKPTKRATVGAGAEKRKSKKQRTAEDNDDAGNGTEGDTDDDNDEEGAASEWDLSGAE